MEKEDGSKRREEEIEKEEEERMGEEEKEGGRGKDKEGERHPGLLPKWEKKKRWKRKKGRKGKKGEKRVKGKVYRHPWQSAIKIQSFRQITGISNGRHIHFRRQKRTKGKPRPDPLSSIGGGLNSILPLIAFLFPFFLTFICL